jgi:3-oxoacyl-[acyl-carrier protein] reductase
LNKKHKVAIVTGGGKRLGKAIAIGLASHGYDISLSYNKSRPGANATAKAIRNIGKSVIITKTDISKKSDVKKLVHQTIRRFKHIDLLVNNAGIFQAGSLTTTSEKQWNTTIDINLKGLFFCCQEVAPYMLKQKGGRIVNIASVGGLEAWTKYLPYSVSKAGVIMLTKILAKSLAPYIHVNAIAPGFIEFYDRKAKGSQRLKDKTLLKRWGRPSDITSMIVYLANVEDYITGQVFVIDGGKTLK